MIEWKVGKRKEKKNNYEVRLMQIEQAAYAFKIDGEPIGRQELNQGHINTTVKITTDTGAEYVLQKINKYVFRDPVRLMGNISAVTE